MDNIVTFPGSFERKSADATSVGCPKVRAEYRSRTGDGQKNMHTYLFRSREALLEADEAELIRDVCCDIDKAQKKLQKNPRADREPAGICRQRAAAAHRCGHQIELGDRGRPAIGPQVDGGLSHG